MKNKMIFGIILVTIFFNYWFPKAGIKISEIPITVSMLVFIGLVIIWLLKYITGRKIKITNIHKIIFVGELYFLFRLIFSLLIGEELSNVVGYMLPAAVYPFIFFIITNEVDTKEKYDKIMKILIIGFFVLCLYSLAQYILGISSVDIPGLTVNYTDYQEAGEDWYLQKSNGVTEENANYQSVTSDYLTGNAAWLDGTGVTAPDGLTLDFGGQVGIDQVEADKKDSKIYDLTGRRVKRPVKGIYIQNGQKVIY